MDIQNKKQGRRKFITWGVASAAMLTAVKYFVPGKPKMETVKMLTEDGKLVEIEIASIPAKKKKITNGELQNWIKK